MGFYSSVFDAAMRDVRNAEAEVRKLEKVKLPWWRLIARFRLMLAIDDAKAKVNSTWRQYNRLWT
jgi:hypothetical protein